MQFNKLKEEFSIIKLKVFHEAHNQKDYYFAFLPKTEISTGLLKSLEKINIISLSDYYQIANNETPDIMEVIQEPPYNCIVLMLEALDLRSPKYKEESLFIYKHISNILSFKMFNSYYDKDTFQSDFNKVSDSSQSFHYIRNGVHSPSGEDIINNNYSMNIKFNEIENIDVNNDNNNFDKKQSLREASYSFQDKVDHAFSAEYLNKLKEHSNSNISDEIVTKISHTKDYIKIAAQETASIIKEKAPALQKNTLKVGKFLGKKILQSVNQGMEILDHKTKTLKEEIKQKNLHKKKLTEELDSIQIDIKRNKL